MTEEKEGGREKGMSGVGTDGEDGQCIVRAFHYTRETPQGERGGGGGTYGTVSLKPPFLPRVIGVRTASIMTTSSGDLTPILVASALTAVLAAGGCLARWEAICVRRAAMVVVVAVIGCCCQKVRDEWRMKKGMKKE